MTTGVYITIDTEYSAAIGARGGAGSRRENYQRSIACDTPQGPVGVGYQMDVFDRHAIKAVFFVDPLPALVYGVEAIADVVGPIVARGHDVQLHLHTEWLAIAGSDNPLGTRTGRNIKDFAFDEQCRVLDLARGLLMAAGAPQPVAFRAGNYGANDDTLRALSEIGLTHDTSHCPGIAVSDCDIGLGSEDRGPVRHMGVTEVPIGAIGDAGAGLRHAQVTALSSAEMLAAIRHARDAGSGCFTLVSHSFELMSRDRTRANRILRSRFERFCAGLAAMPGVASATYAARPPEPSPRPGALPVLPGNVLRSGLRQVEQAIGNALYGAR